MYLFGADDVLLCHSGSFSLVPKRWKLKKDESVYQPVGMTGHGEATNTDLKMKRHWVNKKEPTLFQETVKLNFSRMMLPSGKRRDSDIGTYGWA